MELCLRLLRNLQVSVESKLVRILLIVDFLNGIRITFRQRLQLIRLGVRNGLFKTFMDLIFFGHWSLSRNLSPYKEMAILAKEFLVSGCHVLAPRTNGSQLEGLSQGQRTALPGKDGQSG